MVNSNHCKENGNIFSLFTSIFLEAINKSSMYFIKKYLANSLYIFPPFHSFTQEWAANLKIIQSSWLTQDKTTKIWLLSLLLNLILEIKRYNVKDITRNLCDIINAINWLPKESGLLWAGKLGISYGLK